jgi:hypothetical protein
MMVRNTPALRLKFILKVPIKRVLVRTGTNGFRQAPEWMNACTRGWPVGQLYDLKVLIENKIKADGLDPMDVKGKIGLRSGRMLAFINPNTPDDPAAVAKLRQAVKDVLKINA